MNNAEFVALTKKLVADYANQHMDKTDMQDCAAPMTVTGKGFVEMYPAVTKTSASLSLAILFPTKSESLKRLSTL